MLEQVENKIQQLGAQQKEEYYKRKDEDLIAWGLAGKNKGKKSTPVIVTDEEYEALIEASNGVGKSSRNSIGRMMTVASVVIITIGIIVGGVAANFAQDLKFVYFSIAVVASALLALLFRGVGEAIRLLQQLLDIRQSEKFRESRKSRPNPFPEKQPSASQQFANAPEVHFAYPTANVAEPMQNTAPNGSEVPVSQTPFSF